MNTTVLLCTFNGQRYLQEQLDSIARQSQAPTELIVCDDRSSDSTLVIVEAFALKAAFPVRVIAHKSNLGFVENFLRGLANAKNSAIFLCDQDDIWYPDKIQACCEKLQESKCLLLAHDYELIGPDGNTIARRNTHPCLSARMRPTVSHLETKIPIIKTAVMQQGFSLVMDRRLLSYAPKSFNPFTYRTRCGSYSESGLAHDQIICLIASSIGKAAYYPRPLAAYRIHAANQTQDIKDYDHPTKIFARKCVAAFRNYSLAKATYSQLSNSLACQALMLKFIENELIALGHSGDITAKYRSVVLRRQRDNQMRSRLYGRPSSGLRVFLAMLHDGCYRRHDGGLGFINAARDCFFLLISLITR
jgi:glycosyltransferase involved in cell wall biosynthesis